MKDTIFTEEFFLKYTKAIESRTYYFILASIEEAMRNKIKEDKKLNERT